MLQYRTLGRPNAVAAQLNSLDLIGGLMRGHKPSDVSAFRKRALALDDADKRDSSASEHLRQGIKERLAARRAALSEHPKKRHRTQKEAPRPRWNKFTDDQKPERKHGRSTWLSYATRAGGCFCTVKPEGRAARSAATRRWAERDNQDIM